MSDFRLWFSVGLEHILDLNGYDHLLFVSLLALTYPTREWARLLGLVSAFTLGHSISLALSVNGLVPIKQPLVELLIAVSILISSLYNLIFYKNNKPQKPLFLYTIVAGFGLIHGLGFSYLIRSMLGTGQTVVLPLLYFNLGLELGQLIIVLLVILFSLFLSSLLKFSFYNYKLLVVCVIGLISLKITAERLPALF